MKAAVLSVKTGEAPVNGRVLIVDDEKEYLDLAKAMLSNDMEVLVSQSAETGLHIARTARPDVILLDIRIPRADGIDLCEEIRSGESTKHIPVLMLTGLCDKESRIRAFSAGADDFISKPFTEDELRARVRSKIRRVREIQGEKRDAVICGNLTVNLDRNEVTVSGKTLHFTPNEFMILKLFLENRGKILSRDYILQKCWQDCIVTERTVDSHIAALRKKLMDFDHKIITKHGLGFYLDRGEAGGSGLLS